MFTVSELWQRIEDWYTRFGAAHLLNTGASEAEILAAEKELGFRLPADLRESFARHNGSAPHGWPYGQLLSLVQMLEKYKELAAEFNNPDDDDVEYTEAERAELARLAEDILLPVETASDGTTLLEISVVNGVGQSADESCTTMTGILEDMTDTLGLGNHLYVQHGEFQGLLWLGQAKALKEGVALQDVLKMEGH